MLSLCLPLTYMIVLPRGLVRDESGDSRQSTSLLSLSESSPTTPMYLKIWVIVFFLLASWAPVFAFRPITIAFCSLLRNFSVSFLNFSSIVFVTLSHAVCASCICDTFFVSVTLCWLSISVHVCSLSVILSCLWHNLSTFTLSTVTCSWRIFVFLRMCCCIFPCVNTCVVARVVVSSIYRHCVFRVTNNYSEVGDISSKYCNCLWVSVKRFSKVSKRCTVYFSLSFICTKICCLSLAYHCKISWLSFPCYRKMSSLFPCFHYRDWREEHDWVWTIQIKVEVVTNFNPDRFLWNTIWISNTVWTSCVWEMSNRV